MKIRPRIFLEGNFFVDVKPGTPSAPKLGDGDTLPVTQTSGPVQFDQVLSALNSDTRQNLQKLLDGLGTGLTYKPSAAADTGATRGPRAVGGRVAQRLLHVRRARLQGHRDRQRRVPGHPAHDLSRLIARPQQGRPRAWGATRAQLKDLVTNFNTTMAATASEATNLRTTIRLLAPTLENANSALDSLNAAFPNTRAFARDILPGVRETAGDDRRRRSRGSRRRASCWARPSCRASPASSARRRATSPRSSTPASQLLPQIDLAAKCATHNVLPTGDIKIQDGGLTVDAENYKEFWYTMVGLAGEGQNFDGNGMYVRFQPGGGDQQVALGGELGQNAATGLRQRRRPSRSARAPPTRASARPTSPTCPATRRRCPTSTAPRRPVGPEQPVGPAPATARSRAPRRARRPARAPSRCTASKPATKASNRDSLLGGLNPFGKATP